MVDLAEIPHSGHLAQIDNHFIYSPPTQKNWGEIGIVIQQYRLIPACLKSSISHILPRWDTGDRKQKFADLFGLSVKRPILWSFHGRRANPSWAGRAHHSRVSARYRRSSVLPFVENTGAQF